MFDEDEMNAWCRALAAQLAKARTGPALPLGGEAHPEPSSEAAERLCRSLAAVDGAFGAFVERWMADEIVHADVGTPPRSADARRVRCAQS
jgi:hypothetical protein